MLPVLTQIDQGLIATLNAIGPIPGLSVNTPTGGALTVFPVNQVPPAVADLNMVVYRQKSDPQTAALNVLEYTQKYELVCYIVVTPADMTKDDKASSIFAQIQNAIIANYQLLNPCPITTYTPAGSATPGTTAIAIDSRCAPPEPVQMPEPGEYDAFGMTVEIDYRTAYGNASQNV